MPAKAIRNAVKAALQADAGITAPIDLGRTTAINNGARPRITVSLLSEDVESLYADSPRIENRVASLAVALHEVNVNGAALEDALEDGAEAIRVAIMADETLGATASETFYQGFSKDLSGEGERPSGSIAVSFDVHYQCETFDFIPPDNLDDITGGIDVDDDGLSEADLTATYTGV